MKQQSDECQSSEIWDVSVGWAGTSGSLSLCKQKSLNSEVIHSLALDHESEADTLTLLS